MGRSLEEMITADLQGRGIHDPGVLKAFGEVDRTLFVREEDRFSAFNDHPLPIGEGQTISQPYIVALTVQALDLKPGDRVLEVGAGSGYAAAIISRLCAKVYAIERLPVLAGRAGLLLTGLGYSNIEVITGDGTIGYPQAAPFDAIAVSAAAPSVVSRLVDQLVPGGRMVIPAGNRDIQDLVFIRKDASGRIGEQRTLCGCRFVPLLGLAGFAD